MEKGKNKSYAPQNGLIRRTRNRGSYKERECTASSKSYSVAAPDGSSITFHPCGITSWNKNDVKHFYCALCHKTIPSKQ